MFLNTIFILLLFFDKPVNVGQQRPASCFMPLVPPEHKNLCALLGVPLQISLPYCNLLREPFSLHLMEIQNMSGRKHLNDILQHCTFYLREAPV